MYVYTYVNCSFEEAAEVLRFPYWDWGSMESLEFGLPDEICNLSELTVTTPFAEVRGSSLALLLIIACGMW
jgi:hypothetical protein